MNLVEMDDDTLLDLLCGAVQQSFEDLTDRKYEQDTITEYYSTQAFSEMVFLKNYPVLSIDSIYNDNDWVYGSDTLLDSSDYTFNPESGIVYYNGDFGQGRNNIKITYTYGYVAEVPDPIPSEGYYLFPNSLKEVWARQAAVWYRESKNAEQGVSSRSDTVTGATIQKKDLSKGFLRDFIALADLWRRK